MIRVLDSWLTPMRTPSAELDTETPPPGAGPAAGGARGAAPLAPGSEGDWLGRAGVELLSPPPLPITLFRVVARASAERFWGR